MAHEMANSNEKVCVVTGGSSGIGRAIAERFVQAGFRVVLCGRNAERLAKAQASLQTGGGQCEVIALDIGQPGAGGQLIEFAVERFSRVDVLVNNAGVAPLKSITEISAEEFEACLATNIRGVFATTQAVWRVMKDQGGGAIVNISSMSSTDPFPGLGIYGASKAWGDLFTKAMAEEGREQNIRMFSVRPGAVDTPMLESLFPEFPKEQRLAPSDVAEEVFRLQEKAMSASSGESIVVRK